MTVSTVAGSTIDVSGTLNFTTPRSYVVDLTLKTQNLPTPMPYSIAGTY